MTHHSYHRPHLRMPNYDYSASGVYFLTLCTMHRECWFGEIREEQMILSPDGLIVEEEWLRSAEIRTEMQMDVFQIMPNHVHGIVIVTKEDVNGDTTVANSRLHLHYHSPRPARSISSFVAGFKAAVTKRINTAQRTPGRKIWQDNFYEHIIRNEKNYLKIAQYILDNPVSWSLDQENPRNPIKQIP